MVRIAFSLPLHIVSFPTTGVAFPTTGVAHYSCVSNQIYGLWLDGDPKEIYRECTHAARVSGERKASRIIPSGSAGHQPPRRSPVESRYNLFTLYSAAIEVAFSKDSRDGVPCILE